MNDPTKPVVQNRRRRKSRLGLVIGVLAIAAAGGAWGWRTYRANKAATGEYIYAAVTTGDIEDLVTSTGTLQPRDYVDVGAQVSGQIEKLLVEIGDVVTEGQKLASIDATTSQARMDANAAQMQSSKANLQTAIANLEKSTRDLERQKNLFKEDATTRESLLNMQTTYDNAVRSVETSKYGIAQQEANQRVEANNFKYTTIVAPIAGTVMKISVKQGQTVNASQNVPNVLQIANLATMTVQSDVSEADISKLYKGVAVYFTTLGGQNRRWYSTLKRIEPTPKTQNGVVLYNALFDVQNEGNLMPSMTAQVYFVNAEAKNVLIVPMAALQQGQQIARELAAKAQKAKAPGVAVPAVTTPGSAVPGPARAGAAAAAGAGFPGLNGAPPTAEQMEQFRRLREQRGGGGGGFGNAGGPAMGAAGGARPAQRRSGTVMVKKADGTLETRRVVVGITDRVRGQVLEGLQEGEEVVVGRHEEEVAATSTQPQQNRNSNFPGGGLPGGGGFPGGGGGGRPF